MPTDYVLAGVAVFAIAAMVWLEYRFDRREGKLRRMLGASRTALEVCEKERDDIRRRFNAQADDIDAMRTQFNAQAGELARYRGQHPPNQRLTRVRIRGMPEPEDES